MKKTFTKIFGLVLLMTLGVSMQSALKAQGDAGALISGGVSDAQNLMKAYLGPFGESVGVQMNSGWINCGHPMKLGRFELRLSVPVTFIKTDKQSYDLDKIGLSTDTNNPDGYWTFSGGTKAPTFFGTDNQNALPTITKHVMINNQQQDISFQAPPGIGYHINPIPPAVQLSVGLIKKTEVMFRLFPKRDFGDFNVGLWGFGLKHDIGQWIPVISKLPFTISGVFAYSKLTTGYNLDYSVTTPSSGTYEPEPSNIPNDQQLGFDVSGWNAALLISKKIPVLTVYGGFRYMHSKTDLSLDGTYYYYKPDTQNASAYDWTLEQLGNFGVPFKNSQLGLTAGFRIKIAVLTISGEYNLSKYSTASVGIGLGFID